MLSLASTLQVVFGINSGFIFSNSFTDALISKITGIFKNLEDNIDTECSDIISTKDYIEARLASCSSPDSEEILLNKRSGIITIEEEMNDVKAKIKNKKQEVFTAKYLSYYCFYAALVSLLYLILGGIYGDTLDTSPKLVVFAFLSCVPIGLFIIFPRLFRNANGYKLAIITIILGALIAQIPYLSDLFNRGFDWLGLDDGGKKFWFAIFILSTVSWHFVWEISYSVFTSLNIAKKSQAEFQEIIEKWERFKTQWAEAQTNIEIIERGAAGNIGPTT